jgi:hypothetical protein
LPAGVDQFVVSELPRRHDCHLDYQEKASWLQGCPNMSPLPLSLKWDHALAFSIHQVQLSEHHFFVFLKIAPQFRSSNRQFQADREQHCSKLKKHFFPSGGRLTNPPGVVTK